MKSASSALSAQIPARKVPVLQGKKEEVSIKFLLQEFQEWWYLTIIRHLMTRSENPEKAQPANVLERPTLVSVDRIRLQRCALELRLAGIGDRVGGDFVAQPIADPVGVAGPDERRHARRDDSGKFREKGARVCEEDGDEVSEMAVAGLHIQG